MISDHSDVLSFFALFAGRSVELDALTLFETLVAVTLDAGEMNEDVITLLARDEAEALFCIKKLHCALCHDYSILDATD
jgi:cytochrome c-type biogenesis protein CcmH/NrfF